MSDLIFQVGKFSYSFKKADSVFATIADLIPDGDLKSKFQQATTKAKRKKFLADKKDELLEKVPEKYRYLFEKISTFESRHFQLVELGDERGAADKAHLTVGTSAVINLEKLDPEELQEPLPFTLAENEVILELSFSGNLNLGATVKNAVSVLSAGANFKKESSHTMLYLLRVSSDDYMLEILGDIKHCIVDPSDPGGVVDSLQKSNLVSMERSYNGATTLGFDVGLGKEVETLIGAQAASLSLGASFKAEYKDQAEFSLVLIEKQDHFELSLKKSRAVDSSSMLKLGVGLKLTGFRQKLLEKITTTIPEGKEIKAAISKLDEVISSVSTEQLSQKLGATLETYWDDGKGVIDYLLGEVSTDELAEKARQELQDKIEEEVNQSVDVWNNAAEEAASRVAARITEELGLSGGLQAELDNYLHKAVSKAFEGLEETLNEKAKEIGEAQIRQILQPFAGVSVAIDKALANVSEPLTAELEEVKTALKDIYARYTSFRQKIIASVKDKFEEDFAISLISQKNRKDSRERSINLEFKKVDASVTALFEAMWSGNFENIQALVRDVNNSSECLAISGEYTEILARNNNISLGINFFGLKLDDGVSFSDQISVGIDINGRLITADSQAELSKKRKWLGESQNITVAWNLDYLKDPLVSVPVLIKLKITDKNFKYKEVEKFYLPLANWGLVRSGITSQVQQQLFNRNSKGKIKNATISLNLALPWHKWLLLAGKDLKNQSVDGAIDPLDVGRKYVKIITEIRPTYTNSASKLMGDMDDDLADFLIWLGSMSEAKAKSVCGQDPISPNKHFRNSWQLAQCVAGIHNGLKDLQTAWGILVEKLPHGRPVNESELGALKLQIKNVNDAVCQTMSSAFSAGYAMDDAGKILWKTAAGLTIFRDIADLPNPCLSTTFESEGSGKLNFS